MPSTEEARHGVGVRATGTPVRECGNNRFSLVEQAPGATTVESVALEADTVSEVTGPLA